VGRAGPGNWAKQKPRKRLGRSRSKKVGPISAQHIFFLLFFWGRARPNQTFGPGHNWPGPSEGWINCRTWTISSRSACNFAVADDGVKWEATLRRRRSCCHWSGMKMAKVLVEEMVAGFAACGGGRKKKNRRRKSAEGEGRPRGGCRWSVGGFLWWSWWWKDQWWGWWWLKATAVRERRERTGCRKIE